MILELAVDFGVPLLTNIQVAQLLADSIAQHKLGEETNQPFLKPKPKRVLRSRELQLGAESICAPQLVIFSL